MKFDQVESDGIVTISLSGLLSGSRDATATFEKLSAILNTRPSKLALDLSGAAFIDSLFIGFLIAIFLKCKENNIEFQFVDLSKQAEEIFELAGLLKLFNAQ